MKKFKKYISLVLIMYMLISPVYTNALSIEEIKEEKIKIKEEISKKENMKIENISNKVNYDSLKNTDEIVKLLDESLESSKKAKELLDEVNLLLNNIEEKNAKLSNIELKEEYDALVKEIEEDEKKANDLKKEALNYNKLALEKYEEALNLYNILYKLLNEKKLEADTIINEGLDYNKEKLENLNLLLVGINNLEKELSKLLEEYKLNLEQAEKEKNETKKLVDKKINEIKNYIDLNGEEEINELVDANKNYLTNAILYGATELALKVINKKIENIEKEIEVLNNDLKKLEKQFEVYENNVKEKEKVLETLNGELEELENKLEEDSSYLQTEIDNANIVLNDLIKQNENLENSKNICSTYLADIKKAINEENYEEVIRLLFENETEFGYVNKDFTIKTEKKFNSEFKLLDYVIVTNNTDAKVDSYVYEVKDGVVYIYKQQLVHEQPVSSIDGELTASKYSVIYNDNKYDVYSVGGIAGVKIGNYVYILNYDNGWKGTTTYLTKDCSWVYCYSKPVTKTIDLAVVLNEHYKALENAEPINSEVATNRCEAVLEGSLEDEINAQKEVIKILKDKLNNTILIENKIADKKSEIKNAKDNLLIAKEELLNVQNTLKNKKNMTYSEIKNEIKAKEDELSKNPSLQDIVNVTKVVNEINNGNLDINDVINTINNLDTGIVYKRNIINLVNNILEKQYKDSKEKLEKDLKEDFEIVTEKLKELSPLLEKLVKVDANLIDAKIKNKLVKENLENNNKAKEELLKVKEEVDNNLLSLNNLKENNNLNFLNEVSKKLEEAYNNLLEINEDEIKFDINEFVEKEEIVENNNNNINNNQNIINNQNNVVINQNNVVNNAANNVADNNNIDMEDEDEEDVILDEVDIEEDAINLEDENRKNLKLDEDKSLFNNLTNNLRGKAGLLIIPLGAFLFFLILFKRRKDEEEN